MGDLDINKTQPRLFVQLAKNPQVSIKSLTGDAQAASVSVEAISESGIQKVEICIDDALFGEITEAQDNVYSLSLLDVLEGIHTLKAVAIGANGAKSEALQSFTKEKTQVITILS